MCYHKSFVEDVKALEDYYSAAFNSITEELEIIKERFQITMHRDNSTYESLLNEFIVNKSRKRTTELKKELSAAFSPVELENIKWADKTLRAFKPGRFERYHENGFDFLGTPIITAGSPSEFKIYRWGFIPFFMKDREKAAQLRVSTLNCISEEMYDKASFKAAAIEGKRCLIPVTGFYEWRWLDEKGKEKIPYYVSFKGGKLQSLAGLYNTWTDKGTGEVFNTYTVLTTTANRMMEYVHNVKKRMPVIIPREFEKDWLNSNLSQDDVLALCRPFEDERMRANTISKLITSADADSNVAEVLQLHNYEKIGTDEIVAEF